jgi:hypothetical protein
MKIYVGHSSDLDYREELYDPLRESDLDEEHEIILPHEDSDEPFDSKEILRYECDLFVAEVSKPSTGLGIELGWADLYDVSIVCIYCEGSEVSSSLAAVTGDIKSYENSEELVSIIEDWIK